MQDFEKVILGKMYLKKIFGRKMRNFLNSYLDNFQFFPNFWKSTLDTVSYKLLWQEYWVFSCIGRLD